MRRYITTVFWTAFAVIGAIGLFEVLVKALDVETSQALSTIVLAVVAGATIYYAMSTRGIEEATKEQARETHELAQQTVRQMHEALRPVIIFNPYTFQYRATPMMLIENVGHGIALNVRCWVKVVRSQGIELLNHNNRYHFSTSALPSGKGEGGLGLQTMGTSEPFNHYYSWSISDKKLGGAEQMYLSALYQDVYSNRFHSQMHLRGNEDGSFEVEQFIIRDNISDDEAQRMLREAGY